MARTAFLIGAYGGEHLGDAAILGGVLLRLVRQDRIERAMVASFRPKRTHRLLALIEPPIPVDIVPAGPKSIACYLRNSEVLIWAGGPMDDFPRVLTRNLATALAAHAFGIPFMVEGVGIERLHRTISKWMVYYLLRLANSVTVRSKAAAAKVSQLTGQRCIVKSDPAFDYLATRLHLPLATKRERAFIEKITARPEGTLLVCLNARWGRRRGNQQKFATALKHVATALASYAKAHLVRFVFFPLETEIDSGPDLKAADELAHHLPPNVDIYIWRGQPGIDAILGLLRVADAAVTMRLHASIFALSQRVPTVAIDYRFGARGKVGELFDDLDIGERALGIEQLESARLLQLLEQQTDKISTTTLPVRPW